MDGTLDVFPEPGNASGKGSALSSFSSTQDRPSVADGMTSSKNTTTPRVSRSASPATGSSMGSRAASPVSFGYPYQTMERGLFDNHTPTAIRG